MNKSKAEYEWFINPIKDAQQMGRKILFLWDVFFGKAVKNRD